MNRFYTGVSQDDLQERILKHNLHTYGTHRYTAKTNDWELYHCIVCSSFSLAVKLEKHIKKMKSKTYIQNLKKYPEITEKLKIGYEK
jgi:putative endonuclease